MPNHCFNKLVISGDSKTLKEFQEFAREELEEYDQSSNKIVKTECLLSANKFIPYPSEYAEKDKKARINKNVVDGYNSGGYEWCIDNWGTKWGIYDTKLVEENLKENDKNTNYLQYVFYTAWTPAIKIIKAMGERFPTLKFELNYSESGEGYEGEFIISEGEVIKDTCDSISLEE